MKADEEGNKRMKYPMTLGVVLLACLMLALACSERNCGLGEPGELPSGRAAVETSVAEDEHGEPYSTGFLFSRGSAVHFPNTRGMTPDILVFTETDVEGYALGLSLSQPGGSRAFSLVGAAETLEQGRDLFTAATCVADSAQFSVIAEMVHPYQVWIVKTRDGRFGKILIVTSSLYLNGEDGEVTFDWEYQPNCSRCFE